MKTCPVCELALDDSYLFCPDDGSSLSASARASAAAAGDDSLPGEPQGERPSPVVLYCPKCAAEYPLTFSSCPVHGTPLTRHPIPRLASSTARNSVSEAKRLTRLRLERPEIELSNIKSAEAEAKADPAVDLAKDSAERTHEAADSDSRPVDSPSREDRLNTFNTFPTLEQNVTSERPSFRVAAIATAIGLSLFGMLALYVFVSNLSRRRAPAPPSIATQAETSVQPVPFVPTPEEARDYEEPRATPPPVASTPNDEHERPAPKRPAQSPRAAIKPSISAQRTSAITAPSTQPQMTRVSNSPMPPLPSGRAGGFDSRLVRVRSNRTGGGVRYDLTFNMQEQAGRAAQWQRLLITTRSASGSSHSQAFPFVHRLGAAGGLTFTISVEMSGRSQADWQGRVVCTALGWDNNDRPVQASFGANVTP